MAASWAGSPPPPWSWSSRPDGPDRGTRCRRHMMQSVRLPHGERSFSYGVTVTVPVCVSPAWHVNWYEAAMLKSCGVESAPGWMNSVFGGLPFTPVAVCTRFVSTLCQTTDCPAQMVTFNVVTAIPQSTRMGDELTVSCAVPDALVPGAVLVAVMVAGPPTATPRARPFASMVAVAVLEL